MKLRTYIVEDNATIRENLIGTLEELASVAAVGVAETEDAWLITMFQEKGYNVEEVAEEVAEEVEPEPKKKAPARKTTKEG